MVEAELRDAAVHHGGGGADVAVGVGQFRKLPKQSAIRRQRQGELLRRGDGVRGELLLFRCREFARFVRSAVGDVTYPEKIVKRGRSFASAETLLHQLQVRLLEALRLARRQ